MIHRLEIADPTEMINRLKKQAGKKDKILVLVNIKGVMCYRRGVDDNPIVDDQGNQIPGFRIHNPNGNVSYFKFFGAFYFCSLRTLTWFHFTIIFAFLGLVQT